MKSVLLKVLVATFCFGTLVHADQPDPGLALVRVYDHTYTLGDFQTYYEQAETAADQMAKRFSGQDDRDRLVSIYFMNFITGDLVKELISSYVQEAGLTPTKPEKALFVAWAKQYAPEQEAFADDHVTVWKHSKYVHDKYHGMVIKRAGNTLYPQPISAMSLWLQECHSSGKLSFLDSDFERRFRQLSPVGQLMSVQDSISMPDFMVEDKEHPFAKAPWELGISYQEAFEELDIKRLQESGGIGFCPQ